MGSRFKSDSHAVLFACFRIDNRTWVFMVLFDKQNPRLER